MQAARLIPDPTSNYFWDEVASKLGGKKAIECRDKWFNSFHKSGRHGIDSAVKLIDNRRKMPSAGGCEHDDGDASSVEDDIFNSTPLRNILDGGNGSPHNISTEKVPSAKKIKSCIKMKKKMRLPCTFVSPVAHDVSFQSENNLDHIDFSPYQGSPLLMQNKGYIKKLKRKRKKVKIMNRKAIGTKGSYKIRSCTVVGEHGLQIKGLLSPNGTVLMNVPEECEEEDFAYDSDQGECDEESYKDENM